MIEILSQLADQFIGAHRRQQYARARFDRWVFIWLHGQMEHDLQAFGSRLFGDSTTEGAVWQHGEGQRHIHLHELIGDVAVVPDVVDDNGYQGWMISR